MKNLFRREIAPSCSYCHKGKECIEENFILCTERGVVASTSHCKNFKYSPLKRIPKENSFFKDFEKEDFLV